VHSLGIFGVFAVINHRASPSVLMTVILCFLDPILGSVVLAIFCNLTGSFHACDDVVSLACLSSQSVGTVVSRNVILFNDADLVVKPIASEHV
jgi:hypothetical protein